MTGAELCERLFQSTPPVRGGDNALIRAVVPGSISIRAPREGATVSLAHHAPLVLLISIHAPAKGATPSGNVLCLRLVVISIHAPARGATPTMPTTTSSAGDFNPRPPRGGRRQHRAAEAQQHTISIHAPHEGGDSLGGIRIVGDIISIHAPHEGGDG